MITSSKECSACGACQNICPVDAIHMIPDEYGFNYPQIDNEKCVNCNLCSKVCNEYNVLKKNYPLEAYAALTNITDIKKSASGGVFAALATSVLRNGGVVCGCALVDMMPKHIIITTEEELEKLQGSKYVQSEIDLIFRDLKRYLENGIEVLFCGTPCQVDGLRKYLKKDYDNLILIDLICHGVPNAKMFKDYVSSLEKNNRKVINLSFRDKTNGWGLTGKITFSQKGRLHSKPLYAGESSYYSAFLGGDIYRENCYNCKYANLNRVGDLTIGDYWGIQNEHSDLLTENGGDIDIKRGVSCILVNTQRGQAIIEKYNNSLNLYKSEPKKVAKTNKQLFEPSAKGKNREQILHQYKIGGYEVVEKAYKKRRGWRLYAHILKNRLKQLKNHR